MFFKNNTCFDKKTNRNVAVKKVGNAFEDLIDAKRIVREIKLFWGLVGSRIFHYRYPGSVSTSWGKKIKAV